MAAFHVTPLEISRALQGADANYQVGAFSRADREERVEAGRFLSGRRDVESLVVGVSTGKSSAGGTSNDRPVYLKDVAQVSDGPGERMVATRVKRSPVPGGVICGIAE